MVTLIWVSSNHKAGICEQVNKVGNDHKHWHAILILMTFICGLLFFWILFCSKRLSTRSMKRKETGYGNSTKRTLLCAIIAVSREATKNRCRVGLRFSHLHLFQEADANGRMWHESSVPVITIYHDCTIHNSCNRESNSNKGTYLASVRSNNAQIDGGYTLMSPEKSVFLDIAELPKLFLR